MTDQTDAPADDRRSAAVLVGLDALTYALAVAVTTTVGAVVVGVLTGGGLLRAKYLLFGAGFLLMGYATLRLWPASATDFDHDADTVTGGYDDAVPAERDETRFQRYVRALPPLRWLRLPPPERRLAPPTKLFVGSVFVLAVSYLLEAVFGIA
ncbi:DUF7555 family protein [Natrinema salifodinae]|uniref:Uncharacterized protein n=1 Tax=Natrinema salifodinae TaxID=1202768 RepID=A0A1I0NJK3_9EURY|nr:hypothetical protein [Natrinema salifodinae]SEW01564.1 hypothetical protein SAMN05216285_1803 [Natrinema salifodinae]